MPRLNVQNTIENTKAIINERYCMSLCNYHEIKSNSSTLVEMATDSFIFGYAQGMKAAKSKMRKGLK